MAEASTSSDACCSKTSNGSDKATKTSATADERPSHVDPKIWEEYKKVRKVYDEYDGFQQMEIEDVFKRMKSKVQLKKMFKVEDYKELCLYQKKRIRNIAKNLTFQVFLGLPLPSENELRAKIGLPPVGGFKPMKVELEPQSSDEEWKPWKPKTKPKRASTVTGLKTLKNRQKWIEKKCMVRNKKYDPTVGSLEDLNLDKEFHIETLLQPNRYRSKSADGFKFKREKQSFTRDELRYPKRDIAKTVYTEPVVPEEDHFIFCDQCDKLLLGECTDHPLTREKDTLVKIGLVNRAKRTCPKGISISKSKIRKSGLGAWVDKDFCKNTVFGPYEGENVHRQDYSKLRTLFEGGYSWEIFKNEKLSHYIDGQDMKKSNWLRYINCARNEEEQNIVAYQYQGKIYYKLYKDVKKGNELLVWYGDQYAEQLGIPTAYKAKVEEIKAQIKENKFKVEQEENKVKIEEKKFPMPVVYKSRPSKNLASEFHQCPKCVKVFSSAEALDKHVKSKHPDRVMKKHKCGWCQYSSDRLGHLKSHIRTHTGEKPFKCEICGQSFTESGSLQRHIRTHTGEKPFKCEMCGQSFSCSGSLQKHIRTHTGEKPFKCEICGQCFSRSGSLQKHIRTHTGEKPFKCEMCGQSFPQSGDLKRHIRTHTGEKPYKCKICGQSFAYIRAIKKHNLTHTT